MRSLQRFVAGLLAVIMLSGGQWFVPQTIAWARMMVVYSRQDSLSIALNKTFDGQHPCALCHQIRQGQQEEQHQGHQPARERPENMPELFFIAGGVTAPPAPVSQVTTLIPLPDVYSDFIESPPTPPPRFATAMCG